MFPRTRATFSSCLKVFFGWGFHCAFPLSRCEVSFISVSFSSSVCSQSAQEYKRLPESLFPHTYNPKMSLDISTVQDVLLSPSSKLPSTGKPAEEDKVNVGHEFMFSEAVWIQLTEVLP